MTIKIDSNIELRLLKLSDSADIFNTINNQREYLGKWLPFVSFTQEIKDTEKFVNSIINVPQEKLEHTFTIRKQNQFIGLIGLKNTNKTTKTTEIGYWLSEKFQKQGIMSKSVEKLCNFAFEEQGFYKIEIKCAVKNRASSNIPKKLGFELERIEHNGELLSGNIYTDLEVYSKLKSDF
ncbi:GNAT family N-acetyltransferase [Tenacibaculum piscium]|uniref:GNAT family N-acetyltransferase n=1 Tax=Tenacibaculum piscium TaxID=1458515 RepID=UPI001EFB62FF|nr:GNAT family N-acetyltransferase [Tenacibaculum piscium]MCG8183973.1 GNAT family N-acetyltransferase [Tenacibaculum piscium]MCG8205366.1 GNAT family N-acetyltransferase [Tenacibaculum piscium]